MEPIRVLFAASPSDRVRLQLDVELREVLDAIEGSPHRKRFDCR